MDSLYELSSEFEQLLELGDSIDTDDQQCFIDTLEGLKGEIEIKADQYAAVIGAFKAKVDQIDTEVARLENIKTVLERSQHRMKETLMEAMNRMGTREISTTLHKFKVQKNGGKRKLDIHGEVPDSYKRVVVEDDVAKIRDDLEAGKELDFALLQERGEHLRIY